MMCDLRRFHRTRCLAAAALAALLLPSVATAAPNPWPFHFDSQLASDQAGVNTGLTELGQGLPGLPSAELTEVDYGDVQIYLFSQLADLLGRAVTAGPATMPDLTQTPVTCATHATFTYPTLLGPGPSGSCLAAEQVIANALSNSDRACLQVEFPELYVMEHPPGQADVATVSSFEGLIAVAGEALSHIEMPANLLPTDFFTRLRPIIAKIRYTTLISQLEAQSTDYATASATLSSSAACFNPSAAAALQSTLSTLTAELVQARLELDQLHANGLADAAADHSALNAQCRDRPPLIHPALTDDERIWLSFWIGGIFWRARGAGLLAYPPDPGMGFLRRVLYVRYPFQLIGDLTGGADAAGVGDSILIDENWGWAEWWDMGHQPGSADKYYDLVYMTKRGKRGVNLVTPQVETLGYDVQSLVAGGMQMGPCYYHSWFPLINFQLGEDLQDPYMWFIEWPGSLGEFCAGAALAEGLARTMLKGKPLDPAECTDPVDPDVDAGTEVGTDGGTDGGTGCGPCPTGMTCGADGNCVAPEDDPPDDDPEPGSTAGGGCRTAPTGSSGWLLLLMLVLALRRRRLT